MIRIIRALLYLLLLMPYLFSVFIAGGELALPHEFSALVGGSFFQAALSAFVAVALGMLIAVGLLGLSLRFRHFVEAVVLVGGFIPTIAWVLMWMTLFTGVRGLFPIVVLHAVAAAGLIASALVRSVRTRWSGCLELAVVEGASRGLAWRLGLVPLLRDDLATYALTVFASSLSSFSIPLLMGGAEPWTFEIAIHQAIRIHSAWDQVAALTLWQWLTLVVLLYVSRSRAPLAAGTIDPRESRAIAASGWAPLSLLGVLPVLMVVSILLVSAPSGWRQLDSAGLSVAGSEFRIAAIVSVFVAQLSGLLTATLTLLFGLSQPTERERRLLSSYVAPSAVITGLMLLFVRAQAASLIADIMRIATGCALVFSPVLWRMRWHTELAILDRQLEVAKIFGASPMMIMRQLLWPQLRPLFYWTWGVAAFWAFGDYAIGAVAASRPITLALLSRALLESYRLEAAALLIAFSLLLGFLSYLYLQYRGEQSVGR